MEGVTVIEIILYIVLIGIALCIGGFLFGYRN